MPTVEQWGYHAERRPALTLLWAALALTFIALAIAAVVGLATTGSIFFKGEAAKKTVGAQTDRQVFTAQNKIAQIAFFHDKCQLVNAQLRIVENNQARLAGDERAARFAKDPVRQQQARDALTSDQQDVTGAQNALAATAAAYNSRSAQSTANVFKGSGLPDRISIPSTVQPGFTVNCG